MANPRCYRCGHEGHISKRCPEPSPVPAQTNEVDSEVNPYAGWEYLNLNCGEVLPQCEVQENGVVGPTAKISVKIFGEHFDALVDSGSNVSLISTGRLTELRENEHWVRLVARFHEKINMPPLDATSIQLADAQRNAMKPLAALRLPIKIPGKRQQWIEFLVVDRPVKDLLLGTNAFQRLNISLTCPL